MCKLISTPLWQTEKRILELKDKIQKVPSELDDELRKTGTILRSEYDIRVESKIKPLRQEYEILEVRRQFLVDERIRWLQWIAIIVSSILSISALIITLLK